MRPFSTLTSDPTTSIMSSTLPQYTRFPNPAHTSDESEHLLPRDGQSTRPWYATLFGSRSQAVDVADAPSGTLSSSDDVSSIPDWYLSAMIATAQHNGREAARREVSVCSPGRLRVARARRWRNCSSLCLVSLPSTLLPRLRHKRRRCDLESLTSGPAPRTWS